MFNEETKFEIKLNLMDALIGYLQERPHKEVSLLIAELKFCILDKKKELQDIEDKNVVAKNVIIEPQDNKEEKE